MSIHSGISVYLIARKRNICGLSVSASSFESVRWRSTDGQLAHAAAMCAKPARGPMGAHEIVLGDAVETESIAPHGVVSSVQ